MAKWFTPALLAALMVIASCATPGGTVTPGPISPAAVDAAKTHWPDATAESLEHGRQLFLASCNKCHAYPDRAAYSEDRWPRIVANMGKRAKLSDEESTQVLHFILATRENP